MKRDLNELQNPYDFANPVTDWELFVGRRNEMAEIRYYLDHSKRADRPINIALLGERASGKTSVLNMTEAEAKKKGFCTVRIDLDEDDAKTQMNFFYKLFDGIFSASVEAGAFGGKSGRTYDTYLDIMNSYSIPDDKTFCPFIFPLQYAKALGSGNTQAPLSDNNFKNDLVKIYSEISCPVIVLFDEGNVLASSRVHLEKLRNIFMNINGYMLILTGTQELFPVMDDVFSPIVRQFKKINVVEFRDIKETEECVRRPLEKVGIIPEDVFDFDDLEELHEISSGKPYEIQLICHTQFRQIQEKRTPKMKVNLSILEEVRMQLERSQDISSRPVLTSIRNLNKRQLEALNILCYCNGHSNFDQLWSMYYLFKGEEKWTRKSLEGEYKHLAELGIFIIPEDEGAIGFKKVPPENVIEFAGDDFDKIYAKYFAREQGISLGIYSFPLELFWITNLILFMARTKLGNINVGGLSYTVDSEHKPIFDDFARLASERDDFTYSDKVSHNIELYSIMFTYRESDSIPIGWIGLSAPWLRTGNWFYAVKPSGKTDVQAFCNEMEVLKERAKAIGAELSVEVREIAVEPFEKLVEKIENTENMQLREKVAQDHAERIAKEYMGGNTNEAVINAKFSLRYNPKPLDITTNNNIGYLFMSLGNLRRAKKYLERAESIATNDKDAVLPNYNLGILAFKRGDVKTAREKVRKASRQARSLTLTTEGSYFVIELRDGNLELHEKENIGLSAVIRRSQKALFKHFKSTKV